LLHGCGEGLNILMPFNRFEDISQNIYGWDTYNPVKVFEILDGLFDSEPIMYSELKRKIMKNQYIVKEPVLFYVFKGIQS
jgi:hypothetical protein